VDQPELVSALTALSGFYTNNTLTARRGLRADIERRSVTINQRLIESFEPVEETLLELEGDVDALMTSCETIKERLKASQNLTEQLVNETRKLTKKKEWLAAKTEVTGDFFSKVFLKPEAAAALETGPEDPGFFSSLEQLQSIQAQCQSLLRDHHQRAGLEIMDKMSMQLEAAYERLYRWVQSQCHALDASESSDIDMRLHQALGALKERTVLFKFCIEEIATMRKASVTRRFVIALTEGGPNGIPRPIEMQAHDPQRYVGDILAWMHQALAGEKDLLDALFSSKFGSNSPLGKDQSSTSTSDVLPSIVEALVQPFMVRLEQALNSQPSVLLSYKLANLVDFYIHSIDSALKLQGTSVLKPAYEKCQEHFLRHNEGIMDKLLRTPPTLSPELLPPHSVTEGITRFSTILAVYDTCLVAEAEREADFAPTCTAALDPLLRVCTLAAQGKGPTDVSVFMINVINAVLSSVGSRSYMQGRVKLLNVDLEQHERTVVEDQSVTLLKKCGMADKLHLIQSAPKGSPLANVPGLESGALMESVRKLYASLFGANGMVLPQCDRIQLPRRRVQTRQSILDRLVDVYRMLYEAVVDPSNGYTDPGIIVPHNPQQFVTLLECQ